MSYSQRLLQQGSSLTRLAHQSRFNRVLQLLDKPPYQQVLDYGCGDGLLLKVARDRGLIQSGFGVDISPHMIAACQDIFAGDTAFQFCQPQAMSNLIPTNSCDLLLCTETLEHVNNPAQVLDTVLPYCQAKAKVIISIPIEVGPSLIFKQIGRYLANLKSRYGYERYTPQELFDAAILWKTKTFPSSHNQDVPVRSHKGFDYRDLEKTLNKKIKIQQRLFSPFPVLQNTINSTVFYIGSVR
ncbi:MAG: class I SAM-dependent methyltransferase [Jaaginema sp. PMC 1079.18]|nr:class I SAM-dependent methyltransferase [Jaaginema sp. PMC 1080.18]MEC4851148.1 class I SAM-dependent methyltransferase [Jaaginema sp. PMC 1079.18]MEC4866709.1 class I SAM-dependent methyltransferase [Jaaginema sp. PMC 1078.18]